MGGCTSLPCQGHTLGLPEQLCGGLEWAQNSGPTRRCLASTVTVTLGKSCPFSGPWFLGLGCMQLSLGVQAQPAFSLSCSRGSGPEKACAHRALWPGLRLGFPLFLHRAGFNPSPSLSTAPLRKASGVLCTWQPSWSCMATEGSQFQPPRAVSMVTGMEPSPAFEDELCAFVKQNSLRRPGP